MLQVNFDPSRYNYARPKAVLTVRVSWPKDVILDDDYDAIIRKAARFAIAAAESVKLNIVPTLGTLYGDKRIEIEAGYISGDRAKFSNRSINLSFEQFTKGDPKITAANINMVSTAYDLASKPASTAATAGRVVTETITETPAKVGEVLAGVISGVVAPTVSGVAKPLAQLAVNPWVMIMGLILIGYALLYRAGEKKLEKVIE